MHTIEEFETAIDAKGIMHLVIDEMKLRGKYVRKAIGFVHGHKMFWDENGKCFNSRGIPFNRYNLNLPSHEVKD